MSDVVIEARSLRRAYNGRNVVDVEELQVKRGEVVAVLGPNGSGKSTLFRLLMLLETPNAGEVLFEGRHVNAGDAWARARMAGVFQRPFLFSGTVRRNIQYGVPNAGRSGRVEAAAADLGVGHLLDARINDLSGGEAQRVALARALALRPQLLLLDEPTANLDVMVKRSFREDVAHAARTHAGSVLVITHDPAEAFGMADRIAVMDAGRIVQTGTPEDLLDDPRTPFVASFTGAELLLDGVVTTVAEDLVHVDVGGALIWATMPADRHWSPERGARTHVAYRPEDVMISAVDSSAEVSARNAFRLRIAAMTGAAGLVRLRLEGSPNLIALVTRTSAESLGLHTGHEVIAHMKATALHVLRSA
jgi:molybdopterin-binding protein